jgi:hypothetical protein
VCPGLSVSHPILSKNVVFFDSICHNLLGILACTSRLRKGENGGCIKIKKDRYSDVLERDKLHWDAMMPSNMRCRELCYITKVGGPPQSNYKI